MAYKITDEAALKAAYPQFFKATPDAHKIRAALKLGLTLPGIEVLPDEPAAAPAAPTGAVEQKLNEY